MAESQEIIKDYEPLFTVRTGLTLLIKKIPFFDNQDNDFAFIYKEAAPDDITIISNDKKALVKSLNPRLIKSSIEKGFIMFYETNEKNEVVRNTVCRYKKSN